MFKVECIEQRIWIRIRLINNTLAMLFTNKVRECC